MAETGTGSRHKRGLIAGIVQVFLTGPLSILVILLAALLGILAVAVTPREEEPQIVVPMADIYVNFPGHSALETEQLVTRELERLMWQIQGVEHVYSISRRDQALVTVRFYVGEDQERSMVKLRDKLQANHDRVPPGVTDWLIKPVEIDDVPIVTLTLYSGEHDGYELRRLAEEMKARLDRVRNISQAAVFSGLRHEVTVEVDTLALASRDLGFEQVVEALRGSNRVVTAGRELRDPGTRRLLVGPALASLEDVAETVLVGRNGQVVRLEDVATVTRGPAEPESYVHIGFGPAYRGPLPPAGRGGRYPAATLTFSKKQGTNAVEVAQDVIGEARRLEAELLPDGVEMLVTRDYGKTADAKVNNLLESLLFAVVTVVALIGFSMGWREAVVVGLAVPVSFALALFANYLFGYTINRVTLFALILSLGLVVDDPITNVDNIQRHIRMGFEAPFRATLTAVNEVIPPVIMSTLAIIVSFLPMFFITGMMGPYMGPMAINVPLTVTFSTFCALTFVPWISYHLLRRLAPAREAGGETIERLDVTPGWIRRLNRRLVTPLLERRTGLLFLGGILLLLLGSGALVVLRLVPLKMLPFDNKNEMQLVLDLPEGSSKEETDRVVAELEGYLRTVNEVHDFESYVGVHSPIDFNGLVRHYYLRTEPHQAEIRINFVEKHRREHQSHAIALRLRDPLTAIARRHGAKLKLVEVPPGPPVLATLTVELRGGGDMAYADLVAASEVLQARLAAEDDRHIVEIDDMAEAPHPQDRFLVDRDKAALHGLSVTAVGRALRVALEGAVPGKLHDPYEREPLLIRVRPPLARRLSRQALEQIRLPTRTGMVELGELGVWAEETADQPIYHKDLERVVFVTADLAGRPPGAVVWDMQQRLAREPLPPGVRDEWAGEGEWQITLRVFRDLGLAFGAAMVGIYLLLTVQTGSFTLPLIMLTAIPLTAIGIMPGFFFLNLVAADEVGGYANPVFFTATAMIGMIALGGIVIRNSVVLIEFIQDGLAGGQDVREAVLEAGAVRFRPIVLTAATTMLGAWPITLDPVFSGLAWALIFGLIASTVFTLAVIPTVYMLVGPREVRAAGPAA